MKRFTREDFDMMSYDEIVERFFTKEEDDQYYTDSQIDLINSLLEVMTTEEIEDLAEYMQSHDQVGYYDDVEYLNSYISERG